MFHEIDPLKNPNKLLPNVNGPDLYYRSCKKHYFDKSVYYAHFRRVRKIEIPDRRKSIQHLHTTPSKDNTNNHCSVSEKNVQNLTHFYSHLRRIYEINLSTNCRRIFKNAKIKPGVNNPNMYCGICDITCTKRNNNPL